MRLTPFLGMHPDLIAADPENNSPVIQVNGCATLAAPVNYFTGNVFEYETDISLPCIGFSPMIQRTYNSQDKILGLFGYGWNFNYDERLNIYDSYVEYKKGMGALIPYYKEEDKFVARLNGYGDITAQEDGTYQLKYPSGNVKTFDSSGNYVSQEDVHGNKMSFTYNENNQLIEVIDPAGRKFYISYNVSVR